MVVVLEWYWVKHLTYILEKKPLSLDEVITLHTNKTAKLIASSLEMGGVIVQLPKSVRKELYNFGIDLGVLFQIQDDILDATLSTESAGKPTNSDKNKNSFVNLLGVDKALYIWLMSWLQNWKRVLKI